MSRAFTSLERVLRLEAEQNYQDKAVVGGIRQFAVFWVGQARDEIDDEADLALAEQIGELLSRYGKLPGTEARREAINGLLQRLEKRKERVQSQTSREQPPAPRANAPAATTRTDKSPQARRERRTEPVAERARQETSPEPVEQVEPDPEGLRQPVTVI
ncbi:MAG: hypothetical protein ACK2UK_06070, partial [Candidatus Promineifilaceae bacterium]